MSQTPLFLVVLALLAAPLRAQIKEDACIPFEGIGCWYAPEGLASNAPLIIYLRGNHPSYKSKVPPSQFLASSRQAFTHYNLGKIAAARKSILLVTYRPGLGVSPRDVETLRDKVGRSFSTISVASHSGGYVGLLTTLESGLVPARVVMLDNFYEKGGGGLASRLQRLVSSGTKCAGFYTPHNLTNYVDGYQKAVSCAVEAMGDDEHNTGVNLCLGKYLDGRSCK